MKRILSLTLTLVLLLTLIPEAGVAAPLNGGHETGYATGLIWDTWETIEANLRKDPPWAFESVLPPSVNLVSKFPTPGNQGTQPSCVPWAVAYALRSHQEEVKREWGLHTGEHLFSPAYVYNQIKSVSGGSKIDIAMGLLVEQGVSTLASFPYDEFDDLTKPKTAQRAEAAHFRVADYYTIRGRDSIKRRLVDGDGVVIGINVFPDFDNLSPANPIFDVVNGTSRGGHAVCLIGYDDEKGAFMFINSWGTGWGLGGYGWISYDLMDDVRVNDYGVAAGFVMDARDGSIIYEEPFDYSVSNSEATIVRYLGFDGDVVIPETLGGYPVTRIGDRAFQNCDSLTGVIIPDSVTSIGESAFFRCTSLTNIVFGNGLTTIGYNAFFGCRVLTDVVTGNSVTTIGSSAFSACTSLTNVVIGSGVMTIGPYAFSSCLSLTGFTVNANNPNYASVEGVLFDKSLATLVLYPPGKAGAYTIPESATSIGGSAFEYCTSLTGVVIPDSVTSIGENAFGLCTSLTGVVIPDSVTTVGNRAFGSCTALTFAVIGSGMTEIVSDMFAECGSLTGVVIPDSVTFIGNGAFRNCMSLKSVVIPDSVTSIGESVFHYASFMDRVFPLPKLTIRCYENSTAHEYAVENGIPFSIIKAGTKIIAVSPLPNTENITVNYITITNTANGFYNLTMDFEKVGEVFLILAVYEGDLLTKAYLTDGNAEIKGIAESDLAKGRIYIWSKNMQPCIEAIRI